MRSPRSIPALALFAAALAVPAAAQYTAPGSLLQRSTSKKEQLEQAVDKARWKLGPFRLSPWFAVRDAAYVSDVFSGSFEGEQQPREEVPDFTVTVGAGLQGFVPIGRKGFFTVDALPQYVWWQKQEERRRLNGFYGAGLFGFFNRLTVEATARRAEEQGVVTSEFEQRIHSREDQVYGLLEVEVAPSLFVFGSAEGLRFEALVDDLGDDPLLPPFEQLDRDERALRGGVEYRREDRLRLAAGVERSEVEFDPDEAGRDRSNSGTSPILEASYKRGSRFALDAALVFNSLEPEPGSEFVPFDETTGHINAVLTPRWRLSYTLYAGRELDYSLEEGYSHFNADRFGLSVASRIGNSSSVSVFAETGVQAYARSSTAVLPRQDDFTGYGTLVHLQLQEGLRLTLGAVRTEYDSDLPGFDRSLTVFQSSLEISAFGGAFAVR